MAVPRPFYICIWQDSYEEEAGTRFYAADDAAARAQAGRMASISRCKLREVWKVQRLEPVATAEAEAGSNVQDKTWFLYKTDSGAKVKVSVPAVNPALLELPKRRTAIDRIGGLGALLRWSGTPTTEWVKGLNNYGLRKRDKTG